MWGVLELGGERLCFGFVDLERAFDGVPGKVVGWAMRGLEVGGWLVSAVVSVCSGAKTVVRTVYGNSKSFEVGWVCAAVQHWAHCCS